MIGIGMIGCSSDTGILAPQADTITSMEVRGPVNSDIAKSSFAPLSEKQLAEGPEQGWKFMQMDPTAVNGVPQATLDYYWDGEPIFGSQWMNAATGGFLWV